MAKQNLLNTLLDRKEELQTELGENAQKIAEQGYGGAARTGPDMGRGIPDPRKKRRLPPGEGPGPDGSLADSYPEGGLEDEGLPEDLPPEPEAGIGEEPQPEEVPEKEYLGNTQDTHFYIVQGDDVEGEGRDEDLGPGAVSLLQIVDQDGEVVFSAKESDVEFEDTIGFIMAAVQEIDIEFISRDIYDKYFMPELNKGDDEEEMAEPGEEEFSDEEGFEDEEGFDEELPPDEEMLPPEEEEGGVRGPMGPGPRPRPRLRPRRKRRRRPGPGPGGPGGAPPRGPAAPFESKVGLQYGDKTYIISVVESEEGGCNFTIGQYKGSFSRKLMETYNKMELTLGAMLLDAITLLDERGMSDLFESDDNPKVSDDNTGEEAYMQHLAELYDDPEYGALLKKGDPILFEVGLNEWLGQQESAEWRMGEGCDGKDGKKSKKKKEEFTPAEADRDVQKK
jgi:hypothetical protein